jgi:hypothetical protein
VNTDYDYEISSLKRDLQQQIYELERELKDIRSTMRLNRNELIELIEEIRGKG